MRFNIQSPHCLPQTNSRFNFENVRRKVSMMVYELLTCYTNHININNCYHYKNDK